jgi:serine/threonine protein kinase/Tfp pilus assembly protein PilF
VKEQEKAAVPKDPSETQQPVGRYPARAFETAPEGEALGAPENGTLGSGAFANEAPLRTGQQSGALTGKTVSHYRVLEIVGGGGMGVVYRAQDLKLSRSVALKFLPEEFGSDPRAGERFEREARAASALDHPNICSIYEFGEHEGKPFIVMQLLQGQTLKDRLAMVKDERTGTFIGKPLPIDELLSLAIQIADGLEAAHEKGLLHRDIKPANIFITQRGVAKILDFGLVKLIEDAGHDDAADGGLQRTPPSGAGSVELSRAGFTVGTAAYMSPEQVRGEKLDPRTDLFCFGLLLYEMGTGRRAFAGEDAAALRNAILNREPVPARELNPVLPPKLERIINKCIQKDQALRYQRAADIRTDLENLKRAREHPLRRRWKSLTVAAVVAVLMATGGVYWYAHRTPKFREKDTIVLADFTNETGEAVRDEGLKLKLADSLGDSPYLNVLSDQKVSDTLKLMELPANERLTPKVMIEVCKRTGSKAMLTGTITRAGNSYEIYLNATNCQTGEKLAGSSEEAKGPEEVLNALVKASSRVRQQLGESLASLQKYDTPLPPATTASSEAIQAYAMGFKLETTQGSESAVPFFKRAIELDPNFAEAYAELGVAYSNMQQPSLSRQNTKRAYELRDRVSPRERFHIDAEYYYSVTGELQKANQTELDWIQVFPRDWTPYQDLSVNYFTLGQYEKAIKLELEALQVFPANVNPFATLMANYNAMNQPEKAIATFNEARSHNLEHPYLHRYRYDAAFLQGDDAVMQQELTWAMGDPANQDLLLAAQSDTEAYHGRMESARSFSQRAAQAAKIADGPDRAAQASVGEALREAELGNGERAQKLATQSLTNSSENGIDIEVALTMARAGNIAQAQKLAEKLDREFPQDTMVQNYALPVIRAAIELRKNNPSAAIEILEVTLPYEMGSSAFGFLYPAYLRGEAYRMAGQGQQAAVEYQKLLDHRGVTLNFITAALARLQLARSLAMSGNKAAARKSYEDFLTLWKHADEDLPILKAAKAEYQGLQ